jgi:hypothetical protein
MPCLNDSLHKHIDGLPWFLNPFFESYKFNIYDTITRIDRMLEQIKIGGICSTLSPQQIFIVFYRNTPAPIIYSR